MQKKKWFIFMPTLSGASVLESTLNKTLACKVNSIQLIRKAICKGKLTATEYTLYHVILVYIL